ncbi:putative mannan endo-1 [Phytophthora citrophthora]|uniref:Mannan endo-1 n=1 Tax=Phytophthora citrophthora TaxID=4793 RepID=A0AAD9GNQ8_9STRA|nr:putative mannan endo-1 [Phytophthora citrophthora]
MYVLSSAVVLVSLLIQTAAAGFVTTTGTNFQVDGKPLNIFDGSEYDFNMPHYVLCRYYCTVQHRVSLHLLPIKTDLNTIFKSMATNDIAVCRTMCFADMTTVGTAPYNIAYHFIASILKAMASDTSIKSLQQLDVKLVVTIGEQLVGLWWNGYVNYFVLVSNTDTYVYVKQLGGNYHDDFYTDAKIKTAYKKYISTFVNRYKVSRHETTTCNLQIGHVACSALDILVAIWMIAYEPAGLVGISYNFTR